MKTKLMFIALATIPCFIQSANDADQVFENLKFTCLSRYMDELQLQSIIDRATPGFNQEVIKAHEYIQQQQAQQIQTQKEQIDAYAHTTDYCFNRAMKTTQDLQNARAQIKTLEDQWGNKTKTTLSMVHTTLNTAIPIAQQLNTIVQILHRK